MSILTLPYRFQEHPQATYLLRAFPHLQRYRLSSPKKTRIAYSPTRLCTIFIDKRMCLASLLRELCYTTERSKESSKLRELKLKWELLDKKHAALARK